MINYELAKKLKDAGFPQKGDGCGIFANDEKITAPIVFGTDKVVCYLPTLSELIDACGDRFHAIERKSEPIGNSKVLSWVAYSNEPNELNIKAHLVQVGDTPEEAVANLWLKLNND